MKYAGKNGVVKVDSSGGAPAALSNIVSINITESVNTIPCGAMGESFEEFKAGKASWQGNIAVRKDSGDAKQQLMRAGTEIDIEAYVEGETSGLEKLTGTALVTSRGIECEVDGVNALQFDIQGTGTLTLDTVV